MSERTPDQYVKRRLTPSVNAGYSFGAAGIVATFHWLSKCFQNGHWVYIPPNETLIEMYAFAMLPTLHLVGLALMRGLRKLAGVENEPSGSDSNSP